MISSVPLSSNAKELPGRDTNGSVVRWLRGPGRRLALVLALALATGACTRFENLMASIPVFSFLRDAPFFDPYEAPRPAPPNSVPYSSPVGPVPLAIAPTEASLSAFGARTRNPIPANDSAALQLGRVMYDRFCSVCHGPQGLGNGSIVGPGKFPAIVPNLTLPTTVARTDGYLYGIIAVARGALMPAYGPRMTNRERWATVNYVRELQRRAGAAVPAAQPAPAPRAPTPDDPDTPDTPDTRDTPGVPVREEG